MALALDERNSEARFLLGYAYLRKLMYPEAVAEFARLPEGPFSATKWGALGEAYGNWGHVEEARDALQKLDTLAGAEYISPISRLSVYAGLRDWDRVMEGLEQAYTDHCPGLCLLRWTRATTRSGPALKSKICWTECTLPECVGQVSRTHNGITNRVSIRRESGITSRSSNLAPSGPTTILSW